ncbi:DUF4083 family protein [Alkalihalobacterium bogoriense]|uniref:DUF4083 family protein n=1 Tax=Alkalihalobacterium bogoriense TaxID=246272 RepID=UPI00047DF6EF|nr:DUF4083 family protein [Alkalihalobacterium bogoriense]
MDTISFGSIIYQLLAFLILFGIIIGIFYAIRSMTTRNKKLDRIEASIEEVKEKLNKEEKE